MQIDLAPIIVKIVEADYAYYVLGRPIMSDLEYDGLKELVRSHEPDHPILAKVVSDSGIKCYVCGRVFNNLLFHLNRFHKISKKEYYEKYAYYGPWVKHTKLIKARLRLLNLNKKLSLETKNKIRNSLIGRAHSTESIEKTRLSHIGKKRSQDSKNKMSIAHFGKSLSQEHKNKISIALIGKKKPPRSATHRKNLSIAAAFKPPPRKNRYKTGRYFSTKTNKSQFFRSSWELFVMQYLDFHPQIHSWEYEPCYIKYCDIEQKHRVYIPDFFVHLNCGIKEMWEVKPQHRVEECKNKLDALEDFCNKKGYNSSLITERQIKRMREYIKCTLNEENLCLK